MKYTVRLFSTLALSAILLAPACQEQLDSLDERLTDLEERVSKLEATCSQLNTDVTLLKLTVSVLEGKIYVSSVKPIVEDGEETGYVITFSDGSSSTIYHGREGVSAPIPGVKQLPDGLYYWTLDGELILDADGNPLRATGVTPEFKIIGSDWYVRYGTGEWIKYGQATGDSMFTSATLSGKMLTLVLAGGQTVTLPVGMELSIEFEGITTLTALPGQELNLGYTIKSATGKADIDVIPTSGVKARVVPEGLTGTINMVLSSNMDYTYDKVSVIVTNGFLTVLKKISFTGTGVIVITDETSAMMTCKGGEATLSFATDVAYKISITEGGAPADWVTLGPKSLQHYSLSLTVAPNGGAARTAKVTISSSESTSKAEFTVKQQGHTPSFTVTSGGASAKIPAINGDSLTGLVTWDGEVEQWVADAGRHYGAAGEHSAEYFVEGATGFSFGDLTGLVALNLVDF